MSALAAPAEATPASGRDLKVLLVTERANDPLIERIRAEVVALGLAVVTRAPSGPLESDARDQHAVAAIRALPSRRGVEVWMADATTGRTLARQLVVDEQPQGPNQSLIALQTAEILRTALFPRPPDAAIASPPAQPAAERMVARGRETGAAAGVGALYSIGGTSTAVQGWLSFELRWHEGLGLALSVSLPLRQGDLAGPEGSANVGVYTAGIEGFAIFPKERWHCFAIAGVGSGIIDLRTTGTARPPFVDGTSSSVAAEAHLRGELAWKPIGRARLSVSALAGTTLGRVTIHFAGNEAGTWGAVYLAALLKLGVDWD